MHGVLTQSELRGAPVKTRSMYFPVAERLGPTSVMEGALLVDVGEKVAMSRIEFADRQTNGIVLAVRDWVQKGTVITFLVAAVAFVVRRADRWPCSSNFVC